MFIKKKANFENMRYWCNFDDNENKILLALVRSSEVFCIDMVRIQTQL